MSTGSGFKLSISIEVQECASLVKFDQYKKCNISFPCLWKNDQAVTHKITDFSFTIAAFTLNG